jgi:hypothetical protein
MNEGMRLKLAAGKHGRHNRQSEPPPANTAFEFKFHVHFENDFGKRSKNDLLRFRNKGIASRIAAKTPSATFMGLVPLAPAVRPALEPAFVMMPANVLSEAMRIADDVNKNDKRIFRGSRILLFSLAFGFSLLYTKSAGVAFKLSRHWPQFGCL